MTFPEAVKAMIDGKRITRKEWNSLEEYGVLKNTWLMIHTKGNDHLWQVSEADMVAEDWITVEEHVN